MKKPDRARISQCMIVKNEEKVIEKALSWGKGIVSEQIVVDTGSTDQTVEIAERMGAKVYHFEWIDDFAAAKNYAIEQAQYEWIAFLDADEYFPPEDALRLLQCVKDLHDTPTKGILTGRINVDNTGKVMAINTQLRVFRNIPAIRYIRRIHEHLTMLDGQPMHLSDAVAQISMYHTGYGEEENAKKAGRNLKLIKQEIEDHPDDYEMWGYLGQEYEIREEWEEGEKAFRKVMELMPDSEKGSYDVPTSLAALRLLECIIHQETVDDNAVQEVYQMITSVWPEEADYDYTLGKYYAINDDFERGEKHLTRALELLERYGNTSKAMMLCGEILRAYELLAICCYNNRHFSECVRYATLLLREDPQLMSTAMVLLRAFRDDEGTAAKGEQGIREVLAFLENFYDLHSLKDRMFVLGAAQAAQYPGLILAIRSLFTPEELAAIDQAMSRR